MTTEHGLAERFAETLTAHDLDAFSALLHPDYVNHNRALELFQQIGAIPPLAMG